MVSPVSTPQPGARGNAASNADRLRQRCPDSGWRGLKPVARIVATGTVGVDPEIMGIGPVGATQLALRRAGWALDEVDTVELNEAFAAQYLAVEQELGLDREQTNVDGGAIAIGHPLGASGARITLHLLHALRRRGGRYGLGSACIGGGQGAAVIVEAYSA
jgi:acetyl-CoA acyltransferase 2